MKTTTLLSTALLGAFTTFGSVAYAQDASPTPAASPTSGPGCAGGKCGPRGGMRGDRLAFMTKALSLTDAQVAQIKPILADERTQAKAAIDDNSLSKQDTREKLKVIHQDTQDKIKAILTPEQQQKQAELKAKFEAKRKAHAAANGGDDSAPQ